MSDTSAEDRALSEAFRMTAFIDILGWGSLTKGIPLLTLRHMKRGERLDAAEREHATWLRGRVQVAHRINTGLREILSELHGLCTPMNDVVGAPSAVHFLENSHVTFVRASDCIFAHSSSFQNLSVFASELLKRGLDRGILLRAGIAGGIVHHADDAVTGLSDVRSRDISLFGDAITNAVHAETSVPGSGVRAWFHRDLPALFTESFEPAVQRRRGRRSELRWWHDFHGLWSNGSAAEYARPVEPVWLKSTIARLESGQEFAWNRESASGRRRVKSTIALLHEVLGTPRSRSKRRRRAKLRR